MVKEEVLDKHRGKYGNCRFCGKQYKVKAARHTHRCTLKWACINQYKDACKGLPNFKSLYPTFGTWDQSAQNNAFPGGVNPIPDYIGLVGPDIAMGPSEPSGTSYDNAEPVEQGMADEEERNVPASVDTAEQVQEPEQPQTLDVQPNDLPVATVGTGEATPRKLTSAVMGAAQKATEVGIMASKGIGNKKEWGWRPIILILHEFKMWAFEAKQQSIYFKLNVDQIKLLCQAYYNSFGDSPLTRITGKDFDMEHIDFLSAELTVYGDFYIENAPFAIGHSRSLFKSLQEWKEKQPIKTTVIQNANVQG